ncbi:hypothetical protein BW721_05865 [Jeotgalibaca sp. PTS2502]|uniref:YveK family protein n=1 Tax=Jeotgalibaca sp. PTS2502 TaxID=1903686 RepID=UPI000973A6CA|nr:Wzz/FepE/Etk N-terminal domain-containing protein [Jeotgalibaca sp. PTS2502]APZ49241.1 hypothetical protein BW721_05865 [Jeotgalibaca sp. PTS2502]
MEEEISLEELAVILKHKSKLIVFMSLLGIFISGAYTFFFVTPMYESTTRIVVNQTQNTNQNITNTDIQTNLNLINTYQSIIKEPIILEAVINEIGNSLTINELGEMINVQTETNSLVFGISVKNDNPYTSSELANLIAHSFEDKIGSILDVQSVTILSEATPNLNPVSPTPVLNVSIGFILGFIVGILLAFITEYTDKRVKDIKALEDLGLTNLGSVLEMSVNEINETRINIPIREKNSTVTRSRRRV